MIIQKILCKLGHHYYSPEKTTLTYCGEYKFGMHYQIESECVYCKKYRRDQICIPIPNFDNLYKRRAIGQMAYIKGYEDAE